MTGFALLDVFATRPLSGAKVAVFDEPVAEKRQAEIAGELGFETVFIEQSLQGLTVRIFHPVDHQAEELPFAGSPVLAAGWIARKATSGGGRLTITTSVGPAEVTYEGENVFLERPASVGDTFSNSDAVARCLNLKPSLLGWSGNVFGHEIDLPIAIASGGSAQLMIPVRDVAVLGAVAPTPAIAELSEGGIYCFTPTGDQAIQARFFAAPGGDLTEHPGTGSAAAAIGGYFGGLVGPVAFRIAQGVEIGRDSEILVRGDRGRTYVGGRVREVAAGTLNI